MSCYFYFVLLRLGHELWRVLCYILLFCAFLSFVSVCLDTIYLFNIEIETFQIITNIVEIV